MALTRALVIDPLRSVVVAPITSTIRGAPSEVVVGIEEGLKARSAVDLDHVQTVEQRLLRHYVGRLSRHKMEDVCTALALATGR